jgi:hypothetical protein
MAAMTVLRQLRFICKVASPSPDVDLEALTGETAEMANLWPELIATSSKYLITPSMAFGLAKKGLAHLAPLDVQEYLGAVLTLNRQRNMDIRAQVLELAESLGQRGLYPIFLKGTANLLSGLYEDPGQRVIGDIDVLVPVGELDETVEALKNDGYVADDASLSPPYMYHIQAMRRRGRIAEVEPHFCLHHLRDADFLAPAKIMERSEFIEADGVRIRIPSPFDRICHNIIHGISKHSPFEDGYLYQLYDLSLLLARYGSQEIFNELRKAFAGVGPGYLDTSVLFLNRLFCLEAHTFRENRFYPRIIWGLYKTQLRFSAVKMILFWGETLLTQYARITESRGAAKLMALKVFQARPYWNFFAIMKDRLK